MAISEPQPERASWPCLRRDLDISSPKEGQDGTVVLVRDPRSAELFEFSEEDYFLLSCLDGSLGEAGTISAFEQRFNQRIGGEQLKQFIAMVGDWGLLEGIGVPALGTVVPRTAEADDDSELILPQDDAPGGRQAPRGRAFAAGEGAAGAEPGRRRLRARGIARPGLIAPDEAGPGVFTERPTEGREQFESLGRRRGRGGGMGGGGGGGWGRGGGAAPEWQPQQQVDGVDEQAFDDPPAWTWGHPQRLFAWLGSWLWPLRWVAYLTPVIVAMGLWTVLSNFPKFQVDFLIIRHPMTLFQHLLYGLITLNISAQLCRGIICSSVGGQTLRFGIRLAVGLIPRFHSQLGHLEGLDRRALLWIHGGPLLLRINVFGLAGMTWLMARPQGNFLTVGSLSLCVVGAVSFFFAANPLMRGNGYQLLTVLLNMPDLRQRANRALFGRMRGQPPRPGREEEENSFALRSYALASAIFLVAVAAFVLFVVAQWLEFNYEGAGVALFFVLLAFLVWHFRRQTAKRKEKRTVDRMRNINARIAELRGGAGAGAGPGGGAGRGGGGGGGGRRALARLQPGLPGEVISPIPARVQQPKKRSNPFIRYGVLAVIAVLLFLPYHYEPGGPVTLMPMQQQEIHAEVSGVLSTINYAGGEQVKSGMVIAEVASREEEKNVRTTSADIARKQADLEQLLSTPRPEDVQLAQQALDTARTSAQFSGDEVKRLEPVFKAGHISLEDFEEARKRANVDAQQVLEEEANLRKVRAGPHPKQIEALRHEIDGLKDQLAYYEQQLVRTSLRMPFDGRIVTINLRDRLGQFLEKGALFAEVENDQSLRVEFDIPQTESSEFHVGSAVRIKIWAYPDQIFPGKVIDIAPVIEEEEMQGSVVKVTSVIPNPDRKLKAGMTGFGKIDGGTKPVIVSFSRAIVRFFLIEIWSWLP